MTDAANPPTDRLPGTRHISFQPVMAGGLNGTELILVMAGAFGLFFLSTLLAWPLLPGHLAMLWGCLLGAAAGFAGRIGIVGIKRQRPDGYVRQRLLAFRHRLMPMDMIVGRDGAWDHFRHEA